MNSRPDRLGDQIRSELCDLLLRSVRDPSLKLITITYVRMSRDLQNARIYYTTTLDGKSEKGVKRGLRRAAPFLRSQLARRIRLRRVPELSFVYDDSADRELRIAQVLEELGLDASPAQQSIAKAPNSNDTTTG